MTQLSLPVTREVVGGSCREAGRHVCDPAYLWCDACPELEQLSGALEALHSGWALWEVRRALSLFEMWAGWVTPASGLAGREPVKEVA